MGFNCKMLWLLLHSFPLFVCPIFVTLLQAVPLLSVPCYCALMLSRHGIRGHYVLGWRPPTGLHGLGRKASSFQPLRTGECPWSRWRGVRGHPQHAWPPPYDATRDGTVWCMKVECPSQSPELQYTISVGSVAVRRSKRTPHIHMQQCSAVELKALSNTIAMRNLCSAGFFPPSETVFCQPPSDLPSIIQ